MGRGTPRHYKVKRNNRAFWEPTAAMKALGFVSVPLGPAGPDAFRLAEEWNSRWDDARTGRQPSPAATATENLSPERAEALTIYKPGSLGAAFKEYRTTAEWAAKAPRTREDWFRAWKRIKPVFGDVKPSAVILQTISAFRQMIETNVSLREAHRVIKIWRALWKVAAAMGYCRRDADPSLGVRNVAAKGRNETWIEGEAVRLAKRAWRMGYYGLAAAIATGWDTQLSPGDVRNLRASQLATAGHGDLFFTERGKTGTPVGGALSKRSAWALSSYLARLGVELHGDAFIFRNRSGQPYSKDTLGDDFRDVRAAEFGESERRTMADFRRSGAVEAIVGGGTAEALSHAMGNTLSASNALFATYVPVNPETIREVTAARRRGRAKLR
ncbi:hypothetical protein ACFSX5_01140 [Devosia albogilva]|uniref:Tyr recombinase domain-containing protein n=1 Tax=Devosia albogilva TaxID=429726 RepID=A0ABW5QFK7_9HYPH